MKEKTRVIGVRFTVSDLELIKHQSALKKIDVSTFIRQTIMDAVEERVRISSSTSPCETLYEVKESLYKLILDLKLNKKCSNNGGENHARN